MSALIAPKIEPVVDKTIQIPLFLDIDTEIILMDLWV